jgi:drug/metabolite transporter (DMT)-like permease
MAEVTQLQPLEFIRLPIAGLFAFVMFAEVPTLWTWVGGIVIFVATALVTRAEVTASRQ